MRDYTYVWCYFIALTWEVLLGCWLAIEGWVEQTVVKVLKCGPIPCHIAFIMDGNRRYAVRQGLKVRTAGHVHGFKKFEQILEWCFKLGVEMVTVYAFSIENFRRPREEVDMLMHLAMEKFSQLAKERANEVAIRVIGELDLLPESVRRAACNAMHATRNHSRRVVNICFPYTTTAETLSATNSLLRGVNSGAIHLEDITCSNMGQLLLPVPDLLVRTSGERRLSDFLTWQCAMQPSPFLAFVDALWPEFSMWNMATVLTRYQIDISERKVPPPPPIKNVERWRSFLLDHEKAHWDYISQWQTLNPLTPPSSPTSNDCL